MNDQSMLRGINQSVRERDRCESPQRHSRLMQSARQNFSRGSVVSPNTMRRDEGVYRRMGAQDEGAAAHF